MADNLSKRSKDPLHSAYVKWATSRKDWSKLFTEISDIVQTWEFVFAVITNSCDGENEELKVAVNENFAGQETSKIAEFMSEFAIRHFKVITTHIKKNHNELSLYRIKDQKIAAQMHLPVNSNIFEIRSDFYKTARILIIFQKPRVPSEMELMLQRIQKKALQKKKAWFF